MRLIRAMSDPQFGVKIPLLNGTPGPLKTEHPMASGGQRGVEIDDSAAKGVFNGELQNC